MFPLKSNNIELQPVKESDAKIIHQKIYQNPAFMRLFRISNAPVSEQQVISNIRTRYQKPFIQQNYQEFLIKHRKKGIIGVAALAGVSLEHRRGELLLGLFEQEYRVYNHAIEATLLIMDYAYNYIKLNRLDSLIYDHNQHAKQSTMALGFSYEGLRKEYIYSLDEKAFLDLSCYALLQANFRRSQRLARLSNKLLGKDITQKPPTVLTTTSGLRAIKINSSVKPTIP